MKARMSIFQRTLESFPKGDRDAIVHSLDRWQQTTGKAATKNIQTEVFLSSKCMRRILEVLRDTSTSPIEDLEKGFVDVCRKMKCCGGRVHRSVPNKIGRAVELKPFRDWLHFQSSCSMGGCFPRKKHAAAYIEDLVAGKPIDAEHGKLLMNRFIAWVTWDKHVDPFGFLLSTDPDEVRVCLGLGLLYEGKPILLLTYKRKGKVAVFNSTVADAEKETRFDPPLLFGSLGAPAFAYSRPLPIDSVAKYRAAPPTWKPRSRPEGVHRPARLRILSLPVRRLPK